jgi:hypothetical protein
MKSIAILILCCIGFISASKSSNSSLSVLSKTEDTTSIDYWKRRAFNAEKEAAKYKKLADVTLTESKSKQMPCNLALQKVDILNRQVEEFNKLIQEFKEKIKEN